MRWELTSEESDLGGGNGAAASALQSRFVSLGWDDGADESTVSHPPHSPSAAAEHTGSRRAGSRGDEI